uniref:NTF2-like domain-containing protein n=1 Tax=Caenorhabditis japonica TaxID=281687 RepID=A0A8R1IH71_CAEJA
NRNSKLVSGHILGCERNMFGEAKDGSEVTVNKFLLSMESVIASGNVAHFGIFFEDIFVYNGCRANFGKNEVVQLLARLPKGTRPVFNLNWSKYLANNVILYQVTARGVGPKDVTAMFSIRVVNNLWLLTSGRTVKC